MKKKINDQVLCTNMYKVNNILNQEYCYLICALICAPEFKNIEKNSKICKYSLISCELFKAKAKHLAKLKTFQCKLTLKQFYLTLTDLFYMQGFILFRP